MSANASAAVEPPVEAAARRADDDVAAQAAEELFVSCERRSGTYLVQMVGDRALAEDLLQDTFHDALRTGAQLGEVRNPEAWLFGVARNRALGALRRRRRFDGALRRLAARLSPEHEDAELIAVQDLLARHLSPEDRALVLLRYLHGFDTAELGEMTGLTREAIWHRLSRARARLVRAVDEERER